MATVSEKRKFLRWLIMNKSLMCREAKWFVNLANSDDRVMEKMVFVEDMSDYVDDFGLLIYTREFSMNLMGREMVLYHNEDAIEDTLEAFGRLRRYLMSEKVLYVEVRYDERQNCSEWERVVSTYEYDVSKTAQEVVEVPPSLENDWEEQEPMSDAEYESMIIGGKELTMINNLLDNITYTQSISKLEDEIDKCLSTGDQKRFMELSTHYRTMVGSKPPQLYKTVRRASV